MSKKNYITTAKKSADLDAVNEMFDLIEKKFGPKEEV